MSGRRVLCVGLVCLDIISVCDGFPQEDSDQRCLEQRWQRGGNASNTATVLSMLGSEAEFAGTIAQSYEKSFILADLERCGVTCRAVFCEEGSCPTSVVLINAQSGSRTIVHANRNLPEYRAADFAKIDLETAGFAWIHFEGRRTVDQIQQMFQIIDQHNSSHSSEKIMTSVEIEKTLPVLDKLHGLADVTFISKDYAQHHGKDSKEEATTYFVKQCKPGAVVVCAWGEDGAAAMTHTPGDTPVTPLVSVPAHAPPRVVDTLGAGDTFIAGVIHVLAGGGELQAALGAGCQVAGEKCGIQGLDIKRCSDRGADSL